MIDIDKIEEFKELIPFPLYCTKLRSGAFIFANAAFCELLNIDKGQFADPGFKARQLYAKEKLRANWCAKIRANRNGITVFVTEYFRQDTAGLRSKFPVIDIARTVKVDGEELAVGILAPFLEEWVNTRLLENRVAAYRTVLDSIDTGVHEIDQHGNLIFMNRYERELLGVNEDWLATVRHVCELSPWKDDYEVKRARVQEKMRYGRDLTLWDHRPFKHQANEGVVPVNIFDVEVSEPDVSRNFKNHEIFTVVVDEHIPSDISALFERFGPRNPLLETIGISTFVKVKRRFAIAEIFTYRREMDCESGWQERIQKRPENVEREDWEDELVFTWGNERFVTELIELSRKTKEIGVNQFADILGRTEIELWPDAATQYTEADHDVLESKRKREQIEKHPTLRGDVNVQVLKLPLFCCENPVQHFSLQRASESDEVVGVVGFYWELVGPPRSSHDEIRAKLGSHFEPWVILDEVPLPILMKDRRELRIMYGNQAYITDLQGVEFLKTPVQSLYDIIGNRDTDLFPDEIAAEYEENDESALNQEEAVEVPESHNSRNVRVIKTPFRRGEQVAGVQTIFWYEHGKKGLYIDWMPDEPRLYIEEHEIRITRAQPWVVFEVLLRNFGKDVPHDVIIRAVDDFTKKQKNETSRTVTGNVSRRVRTLVSKLNKDLRGLAAEYNFHLAFEIGSTNGRAALSSKHDPSG